MHLLLPIPNRYAVPVPDLPRYAPVTQIIYPMIIDLLETLGNDLDGAAVDCAPHYLFQGRLAPGNDSHDFRIGQFERLIDRHEPLVHDLRLDDPAGALGRREVV